MKGFKFFLLLALALPVTQACTPADACTPACELPECACSFTEPDIPLADRPQFILLSFVDAVTRSDGDNLAAMFSGQYLNPNNCPMLASHFVSAYRTDYVVVNDYHGRGHEIGSESITHNPDYYYWYGLTEEEWSAEMGGMKQMISSYANILEDDIVGTRAPYFCGGGNAQYEMMADNGFKYDNTQVSKSYGYTNMGQALWPFTQDYQSYLDCRVGYCPTCTYPGIWNQPYFQLEDANLGANGNDNLGGYCELLDDCIIPNGDDAFDLFDMLKRNFDRAYGGSTRAPFSLSMTYNYLRTSWHLDGLIEFISYIVNNYDNVWFVTPSQAIAYRQSPATNDEIMSGTALSDVFGCSVVEARDCDETACVYEDVVTADFSSVNETMFVCGDCPDSYPWLGNPLGLTN